MVGKAAAAGHGFIFAAKRILLIGLMGLYPLQSFFPAHTDAPMGWRRTRWSSRAFTAFSQHPKCSGYSGFSGWFTDGGKLPLKCLHVPQVLAGQASDAAAAMSPATASGVGALAGAGGDDW